MICYRVVYSTCVLFKRKKNLYTSRYFYYVVSEPTEWSIVELAIPTTIGTLLRVLETLDLSSRLEKVPYNFSYI